MRLNIYNNKAIKIFCTVVLISMLFPYCTLTITNVDQPSTAVAGTVIPIRIDVNFDNVVQGGYDAAYVIGILAPKGWNVAENAEEVTYVSTKGNGKMRLMEANRIDPAKENTDNQNLTYKAWWKQKFGIGGNLIDDMEWVFFEGEEVYYWGNGDDIVGHIDIKLRVGMDGNNTLVKLGYGICNTRDGTFSALGPTWVTYFGSCFEVTGGTTGETIDFCNPQLTNVTPGKITDNDLATFTFDGNVVATELTGKKPLYLCATGTVVDNATNAESTVDVCEQTAKTAMKEISNNRHAITIWPVDFFKVTESQTLKKVTYFITDETGTIKVGYNNTDEPFSLVLKCN